MDTPELPLLITVPEVAALLWTSPQAVYAMVARGQIPATRLGRRVLFRSANVLAWLDAKRDPAVLPPRHPR